MDNPGKQDKKSVPELFRDAWSQALAAVSNAEDEAQKVLGRVSDVAGWGPDEVRRHYREFADRLVGQRKELEKSIDAGVKKALLRVKLPKREDVDALSKRVAALSARVEALAAKRAHK